MEQFDFLIQNDWYIYNKMVTLKQREGLGMGRNQKLEYGNCKPRRTMDKPLEFRKQQGMDVPGRPDESQHCWMSNYRNMRH